MDRMNRIDSIQSMLDAPSPAVLTVYRPDGSALVSPVWFRVNRDAFEVVIATGDGKLTHLRRDPRCVFLAFETTPPFRGIEVRAEVTLRADGVAETRLAIASRYLGAEQGRKFAERRGGHGFVLRLPLAEARIWDLHAILPM